MRNRHYTLFNRILTPSGKYRYERLSMRTFPLDVARRVFQSNLIYGCIYNGNGSYIYGTFELRPVKVGEAK